MGGKTAFVTGGTGFLGRHLIEELVDGGWEVTAMHRASADTSALQHLGVKLACCALDDEAGVIEAMPVSVDAVFHVAGDTSFWRQNNKRQYTVNVVGTRTLLAAALANKAGRFVHTSTISVYGARAKKLSETSPHQGRTSSIGYLTTKAEAEDEVRAAISRGLDAVMVNPCNIIGPYDTHNWSRLFKMVQDNSLPGVPPGAGSFCHARDVARAHISAYEKGRTGENYILNGTNASHLEVIQMVAKKLDRKAPKKATPAFILHVMGALSQWTSNITRREPDLTPEAAKIICAFQKIETDKAAKEFGYVSASLDTMLDDCIAWMKSERLLT